MNERYLGYNFTCPISGSLIPQRVQNLCIRDYAKVKGLTLVFSAAEYWDADLALMLFAQFRHQEDIAGLIFYSMLLLPSGRQRRFDFYQRISESKWKVHFALENLVMENEEDRDLIERMYQISTDKRLDETRIKLIEFNRSKS